MPDHKNQHYVPRCYLKAFSKDGSGKAINLLNIEKELLVQNASIRNQCAKDYFYGSDLVVERGLQGIEGQYASAIKRVTSGQVDASDLQFLRDFCYLQYLRTDIAAKRTALAMEDMKDLVYERVPDSERPTSFDQKEWIKETIHNFVETVDAIGDLKICLVKNEAGFPLITSDDPAVLLNRFYSQRLGPRWKSFGIGSAGAMLLLPLSPTLLICSYDSGIYTCPDIAGHVVRVDKRSDIKALNSLQCLKASRNLYFSDWAHGAAVKDNFAIASKRRPKQWHNIHFAVKDESRSTPDSECFRVVHTRDERMAAEEAFLHLQNVMLEPDVWFSKIKFRHKLKYVYNETGAGYKRYSR